MFENSKNWFVKGFMKDSYDPEEVISENPFADEPEFDVIVTDLVTTGYWRIVSAVKNDDGYWIITFDDGSTTKLLTEPKEPRALSEASFAKNYIRGDFWNTGDTYDEISPEEAFAAIGHSNVRIVGYNNGNKIVSGTAVVTNKKFFLRNLGILISLILLFFAIQLYQHFQLPCFFLKMRKKSLWLYKFFLTFSTFFSIMSLANNYFVEAYLYFYTNCSNVYIFFC